KPRGPFNPPEFMGLDRDNNDFWREHGEFTRVNKACIAVRFVLTNLSSVQLSNSKLEVTVEALGSQTVQMIAGRDLPDEPKPTWNIANLKSLQEVWAEKGVSLEVDESGPTPVCHIRLGSLLPGEHSKSELLTILPHAPGRLR